MDGVSVAEKIVESGWASVADRQKDLKSIESESIKAKRGIWSGQASIHIDYSCDPRVFFDSFKDQTVNVLVEYVRDGHSFKVLVLETMQMMNCYLSGVECPSTRQAEPFAEQALYFSTTRVLQKQLKLRVEGYLNAVYGTFIHPAGNLSEALLVEGLGHVAVNSIAFAQNPKLIEAEK